jgi:putative toxin-antitoxin system antitoxin component (TIGR02293 family)
MAYWLNVNVKTMRTYRNDDQPLRPDVKEQLVMLLALARHGMELFGDGKTFGRWLNAENLMLDKKKPSDLLNTNSGVRMMDDRLTGMEYGDNA